MKAEPNGDCPAKSLAERLSAEGYLVSIRPGVIGTREYVVASSQSADRGLRLPVDDDCETDMCFQHAA